MPLGGQAANKNETIDYKMNPPALLSFIVTAILSPRGLHSQICVKMYEENKKCDAPTSSWLCAQFENNQE